MAAMNVKHGFVRAFGLAGKIVILDEVHSYDAYTSVILDELIALLRQLHCTVIILSATLTQIRRQQLLGQSVSNEHYPLVSCSSGQHPEFIEEINVIAPPASKVELKLVPMDDKGALSEALARAQTGQLVLWIENTVTEAQNRFFDFAGRCQDLGVDCGLLHSRFTQQHRQKNENIWVSRYGKVGNANRGAHGGILIGTQVLEQSLDIDADFLISRIAPTDMLLQRIGRLWRHQSTTRPVDAHCDAWILAPDIELAIANPLEAFGPTAWVYSTYVLCRSLEVWRQVNECGHIELPRSIRNLIERTYSERQESGSMGQWKDELYEGNRSRKGLKVLQQLARMTLSRQGKTLPESKAQTRYSEGDNTDLLLLKKFVLDTNMKATQLTLLDNRIISLPWQAHRLTEAQWKQIAVILMQQIVTCREEQAPTAPLRVWCQKIGLGHALYLGDPAQDDSVISIAVVTETGELISLTNNSLSDKWRYQYRDDLGLQIIKVKE
jgi:CRISPR-associated endonuclease/helicase Cas3